MNTATITLPDPMTSARPGYAPRYKVIIHNDDVTPMQVVVAILHMIFNLQGQDAMRVMLEAHEEECAIVGAYPMEQAEFRIEQAISVARSYKSPLRLTMEPE